MRASRRAARGVAACALAVTLAAACVGGGDRWAAEAKEWTAAYVEVPNEIGGAAYYRFWAEDMWWDYRSVIRDAQVVSRQGAVAEAIRFIPPGTRAAEVDSAPFISVDGAVVPVTFDWGPSGADQLPDTELAAHLVTLLRRIGPDGAGWVTTAMSSRSWRERRPTFDEADEADMVAELWAEAWTSGDDDRLAELYADIAVVSDSIAGWQAYGIDEIRGIATGQRAVSWSVARLADGTAAVYPVSFFHAGLDGLVALLDGDGAGCSGRIAVVLEFNRGRVVSEDRYWEIGRARSCLPADELPAGWWTDHSLTAAESKPGPTEDLETVTGSVAVGEIEVELRNSTEHLDRLAEWALWRFAAAGLAVPEVISITFSDYSAQCDDVEGRVMLGDRGWEILICHTEAGVCRDEACTSFEASAENTALHELAHIWMEDHLDTETRRRYMDEAGLKTWDDPDALWSERAVEHAAETIAWGLMDAPLHVQRIGGPSTDELTAGFELLTGVPPIQPWR